MFAQTGVIFESKDDLFLAIHKYEIETGFRLCVRKSSIKTGFRSFKCGSHVDCNFLANFGPIRSKQGIFLKKYKALHNGVVIANNVKQEGGRLPKQRTNLALSHSVIAVARVKHDMPLPNDVRKAGHNLLCRPTTYHQAFRAIKNQTQKGRANDNESFQLIIPYLRSYSQNDPEAVIDYLVDDNHIEKVFICPSYMNKSLQFVRPVISFDAAHLKHPVYKGILYVATVLTALDNAYTVAFALVSGNEDHQGWSYFCGRLRQACPILTESHPMERVTKKYFTFISDRDKGLKEAISEWFPNNHATHCAVHIQRNVVSSFGRVAGREIIQMAKTFSRRKEEQILQRIAQKNQKAYDYVIDIPPDAWRSSQWIENESLPPRYGIVSTNVSESINMQYDSAREMNWFYCIDSILNKMFTTIHSLRLECEHVAGSTPKMIQVLKKRYESSAGLTVFEYKNRQGLFQVVRPPLFPTEPPVRHNVDVVKKTCTCGIWQDFQCPCVDAIAFFRHHQHLSFDAICSRHSSRFFTNDFQSLLLENNLLPPIIDTLAMDGCTLPPKETEKKQAGRPRKKRLRTRSKVIEKEDSKIKCSICGERGHNMKTCGARKKAAKSGQTQELDLT
jgi:hypothetical protein